MKDIMKGLLIAFTILTFAWLLVPMISFAQETQLFAADHIEIENAFAKPSLKGQSVGVGFVTMHNQSDQIIKLVSVDTEVAMRPELHDHIKQGDRVMMRKQDAIEIPANGTTQMKPGGLHIMLMMLKQPLQEGETFEATLHFADGSSKPVTFAIKKP